MQIETKFWTGDKVFFLHNNKVVEHEVLFIEIKQNKHTNPVIVYGFDDIEPSAVRVPEDRIFRYKSELLQSL